MVETSGGALSKERWEFLLIGWDASEDHLDRKECGDMERVDDRRDVGARRVDVRLVELLTASSSAEREWRRRVPFRFGGNGGGGGGGGRVLVKGRSPIKSVIDDGFLNKSPIELDFLDLNAFILKLPEPRLLIFLNEDFLVPRRPSVSSSLCSSTIERPCVMVVRASIFRDAISRSFSRFFILETR